MDRARFKGGVSQTTSQEQLASQTYPQARFKAQNIAQRRLAITQAQQTVQQQQIQQQVQPELTPQEKAVAELKALGNETKDIYGGTFMYYDPNALAIATAIGAQPGAIQNRLLTGTIRYENGRLIYNNVDIGSSTEIEKYAQNIEARRQQQSEGTIDTKYISPKLAYSPGVIAALQKEGKYIGEATVYVTEPTSPYYQKDVSIQEYVEKVQPAIIKQAEVQKEEAPIYANFGDMFRTPTEETVGVTDLFKVQPDKLSFFNKVNIGASLFLKKQGITVENVNKFLFGNGLSEKNRISEEEYYKKYPGQRYLENLQLGISTQIVEKPITTGLEVGALIALPIVAEKVVRYKEATAIAQAKTIFISKETLLEGKSAIKTISQTSIGGEKYTGLIKQGVVDYETEALGLIRVSSSRGLIITGTNKVYPIDIVTERINPFKDFGVSKVAGEATSFKTVWMGEQSKGLLGMNAIRIGEQAGQGVLSSIAVKSLEGGYIKTATVGGFKQIGEEAKFVYTGGNKLMLNIKTGKIGSKINIRGTVYQESLTTGEETLSSSLGGTLSTKQIPKLTAETKVLVSEAVAGAQTKAIDVFKMDTSKLIATAKPLTKQVVISGTATTLLSQTKQTPIITTSLRTKQETQVIPRLKQETAVISRQDISNLVVSRQGITSVVVPRIATTTPLITKIATTTRLINIPKPILNKTEKIVPAIKFNVKQAKNMFPKKEFNIQVRRQGIFKTIGRTPNLGKALALGSQRVSNTLAATFRIRGQGNINNAFKLPSTIKRVQGKPMTFIEIPKARLDTAGELREINMFKNLKEGRK